MGAKSEEVIKHTGRLWDEGEELSAKVSQMAEDTLGRPQRAAELGLKQGDEEAAEQLVRAVAEQKGTPEEIQDLGEYGVEREHQEVRVPVAGQEILEG